MLSIHQTNNKPNPKTHKNIKNTNHAKTVNKLSTNRIHMGPTARHISEATLRS